MNNIMDNNDIQQSILQKINQGEIKMRPRYYFIFGSILITIGTIGVIIAGTFFVSHAIFMSQRSPLISFLGFGPQGISPFLQTFPWLSVIVATLSIVLGILFLRHYDFSYKTDSKTFVLIVVGTVLTMGIITNLSGLNEQFETFEPTHGLYNFKYDDDAWIAGVVTNIEPNFVTIFIPDRDLVVVKIPNFIPPHIIIRPELQVTFIGEWDGEIFIADKIQTPQFQRFPKPSVLPMRHVR